MRPILVFVAVVVIAALIWLALPPSADRPPLSPTPNEASPVEPGPEVGPVEPDRTEEKGPGTILGTVTRDGKPVAARVLLRRLGTEKEEERMAGGAPRTLAETRADGTGQFTFRNVTIGPREVMAIADDGARGRVFALPPRTGVAAAVRIVIPAKTLTFRLRAVYADGRPFDGEIALTGWTDGFVEKEPSWECWREEFRATGPDGRVTFPGLPPGLVRPFARIRGSLSVRGLPVRLPREGEYRFVVDRGLRWIVGSVVADEDGTPVAGALIRATGDFSQEPEEGFVSGAMSAPDGRFMIRVAADSRALEVRAEGFRLVHPRFDTAEEEVLVRLKRPPTRLVRGTIRGRVLHRDEGTPIEGAIVQAIRASGGNTNPDRATTDAEGRFTLSECRTGSLLLYVLGGGWVSPLLARSGALPLAPLQVTLDPESPVERDLLAIPSAGARILVLDAGGESQVGVPVAVRLTGVPQKSKDLWRAIFHSTGRTTVRTGEDGTAEVRDLPPGGRISLLATPAEALAVTKWQNLPTDGGTAEITITIPAVAVRKVQVVFEDDGTPLAGAVLRVWEVGGTTINGFWMTDDGGRAEIGPLPAGDADVRIAHPEIAYRRRGWRLPAGPGPSVLEVDRGRVIGGAALLPDGSAAVGGFVSVIGLFRDGNEGQYVVRPDADGRWLIRGIPPGKIYQLHAGLHRDGQAFAVTLREVRPGALDHILRLEEQGRGKNPRAPPLEITVLGPGGTVARGGTCRCWMPRRYGPATVRERAVDETVRMHLPASAKDVRLEIVGATADGVLLAPHVMKLTKLSGPLTIRLTAAVEIRGRVIDEAGRPVPGVAVSALSANAAHIGPGAAPHAAGASGPDGSFRIEGLADAPYDLSVVPTRTFIRPDLVRTRGGATEVVIRLRAGVVPVLKLRDEGDKPVTRLYVRVLPEGGQGHPILFLPDVTASADGRLQLRGLDPARRYHLSIWPRGELLPVTLDPWEPADTLIRFAPSFVIHGTVRNAAGEPVRARVCHRRKGTDRWNTVRSGEDGAFRIHRLPPGEYELCPLPDGGGPRTTLVVVRAGNPAVTLTLP